MDFDAELISPNLKQSFLVPFMNPNPLYILSSVEIETALLFKRPSKNQPLKRDLRWRPWKRGAFKSVSSHLYWGCPISTCDSDLSQISVNFYPAIERHRELLHTSTFAIVSEAFGITQHENFLSSITVPIPTFDSFFKLKGKHFPSDVKFLKLLRSFPSPSCQF